MTRATVATLAALLLAGSLGLSGHAQDADPTRVGATGTSNAGDVGDPGDSPPAPIEISHPFGADVYIFDAASDEPLIWRVVDRSGSYTGEWVTSIPFARLPDGRLVALTPCDNLATLCVPLTTAATGALATAKEGDTLVLAPAEEPAG